MLSFCIITNGSRPEKLELTKKSIFAQSLNNYEIILVGNHREENDIIYIPAEDLAHTGNLGAMRNLGLAYARGEHIVILDDDILLTQDWAKQFQTFPLDFAIMTSKILSPDGTRFWDHATFRGPNGHRLLAENEDDAKNLYMSGGTAWAMHRKVWEKVKWDEKLRFNEAEDVDFSQRCHDQGFAIRHNPRCVAYHYDCRYTRIARLVLRRESENFYRGLVRSDNLNSPETLFSYARTLYSDYKIAEPADILRLGNILFPAYKQFAQIWAELLYKAGGDLSGDHWYVGGDPTLAWFIAQLGNRATYPALP